MIEYLTSCLLNFKNRHFEKRLIKEKRVRMSSWQESISWTRDAVLERESAPDLLQGSQEGKSECKRRNRRLGSAIEGQSLLPSELRHRRGNEAIERSNPFSTCESCWEAG